MLHLYYQGLLKIIHPLAASSMICLMLAVSLLAPCAHAAEKEAQVELSELQVMEQLNTGEKLRWAEALDIIKRAESDIESGEWMLQRSKRESGLGLQADDLKEDGENLIKQAKEKIAEAEESLATLRALAIERYSTKETVQKHGLQYTLKITNETWDTVMNWPLEAMDKLWKSGYRRLYFMGAYRVDETQSALLEDLTAQINAAMEAHDNDRYSFIPHGERLFEKGLKNSVLAIVARDQEEQTRLDSGMVWLKLIPAPSGDHFLAQLLVVDRHSLGIFYLRSARVTLNQDIAALTHLRWKDTATASEEGATYLFDDRIGFIQRMGEQESTQQYRLEWQRGETKSLNGLYNLQALRQLFFNEEGISLLAAEEWLPLLPGDIPEELIAGVMPGQLVWKVKALPGDKGLHVECLSIRHNKQIPVGRFVPKPDVAHEDQ